MATSAVVIVVRLCAILAACTASHVRGGTRELSIEMEQKRKKCRVEKQSTRGKNQNQNVVRVREKESERGTENRKNDKNDIIQKQK
jgi:hypothetical protein